MPFCMRRILVLFLCSVLSFSAVLRASVLDNGTSKVQIIRVKNMIGAGEYYEAMRVIRDLEKSDTANAELAYLGGKCHMNLRNYEDALERLQRSVRLAPNEDFDKYFFLARTLQLTGKLNEAAGYYEQFLAFPTQKSLEREDGVLYLGQCRNAMELLKTHLPVKIRNLGDKINSEYPEYNPSVSADGKKLIFTSRRPESTGKLMDPEDDKFYEDIYISVKDSISGEWLPAEAVPGRLNTETHDANMCISPDGNQIFVYRNMGMRHSGAILSSKLSRTGKWGEAKMVEGDVNTSYFESSACLSPDGKYLYFVSERPRGGFGMGDIYRCKRESKTSWGAAENLGPVINDEFDQIGVFIHPDGKTMYFASNGPTAIGGYDIFRSTFENGQWSKPENLGSPINSFGDERFFCLSTDARTAWFSSNRDGGSGDLDIWEIDFSALILQAEANKAETQPAVPKGPPISILSGKVIDSNAGEIIETEITITDKENGKAVIISSDENGQYFCTLEGNRNYVVEVKNPIFKDYRFECFLKAQESGTFTLEKLIVLEKK